MSRKELKRLEGKLRLYLLLHNFDIKEVVTGNDYIYSHIFCRLCPLFSDRECTKNKVVWVNCDKKMREMTLSDAQKIKKRYRCVEWVKHV
jgi:hypothetical protein